MGTYASTTECTSRVPERVFSTTSKPTLLQIEKELDDAESLLEGTLDAIGVGVPITTARGIKNMRAWTCDYVEGYIRKVLAGAFGDDAGDDGTVLFTKFADLLEDMRDNSPHYSAMLEGGAVSGTARRVRSYVTDNADSKTVSSGDFIPEWTRDEKF